MRTLSNLEKAIVRALVSGPKTARDLGGAIDALCPQMPYKNPGRAAGQWLIGLRVLGLVELERDGSTRLYRLSEAGHVSVGQGET